MMWRQWLPLPLLLASVACEPNEDLVRLQREIAILEDRVGRLQLSFDARSGEISALLKKTLARATEVQTASAALDDALKEQLRRQEQSVEQPIAAIGDKANQAASELLAVRDTVAGLHARLRRIEQQLTDLETAIRVLQAPPAPPSLSAALGGPPAGLTPEGLFQAALRDHIAGKEDMALQGFLDYLKYFDNTELAASSQFHIGEIAFNRGDTDSALEALQFVLERYPTSGKAPDALYLKAKALEKRGSLSGAVQEFYRLVRRYPNSDAARRAQPELERLRATPGTPRKPS